MSALDLNNVVISQDKALVPKPSLIDGRTERDWLCFISDFASVINFYESTNQLHGNWKPFLLKDPVFLLANISKAKFAEFHTPYLNACTKLETGLTTNANVSYTIAFNQAFDAITEVFKLMERWIYYMQRSGEDYEFKKYIIRQIKKDFSALFWAINAFRENLSTASSIEGIERVEYHIFDNWDEIIWKQSRDKSPFWEILNLHYPLSANSTQDHYNALRTAGDRVFDFFHTVIRHSARAFEELKNKKSRYPDTTLLRAFINLLTVHQEQLNGIAEKHLDFYYKDILQQQNLPATPDSVFLCAGLSKKDATFLLPAGTLFDGGIDAQKNPVLFASQSDVILNPASITGACTIAALPANNGLCSLYRQNITTPGVLKKDANGKLLSWETFGGFASLQNDPVKQAISFASPMLLLREGLRTISLTLTFNDEIQTAQIKQAHFYLSTQTAWLDVTTNTTFPSATSNTTSKVIAIQITLQTAQAPVEPFVKNPDGYASSWPLLKIEFDSFYSPATPPVLNSLTIDVSVSGVKNLLLYNDFGSLSSKTPFPLFGPTPSVNNNFIIGSNEIFSKPLTSFYMELDWDQLPNPPDFQAYYQQYNNYLAYHKITDSSADTNTPDTGSNTPAASSTPAKTTFLQKAVTKLKSAVAWTAKGIISILQKIAAVPKAIITGIKNIFIAGPDPYHKKTPTPYNNTCFTVNFSLLKDNTWGSFVMNSLQSFQIIPISGILSGSYQPSQECKFPVLPAGNSFLFRLANTQKLTCVLTSSSFFGYEKPKEKEPVKSTGDDTSAATQTKSKPADPSIQITPLKFSDTSSSGFVKMTLSGPGFGFGSSLYPNIVSDIALFNAYVISQKKPLADLAAPANPPFVPMVKSLVAHYAASQKYTFSKSNETNTSPDTDPYPIQCYLYSPFTNYLAYDNTQKLPGYNYNIIGTGSNTDPAGSNENAKGNLFLFPPFCYNGILFLQLQDLIPSATLNLYFQLARNYTSSFTGKEISYFYLSNSGWKELQALSDGTNGFACPGILTINVPDDISLQSAAMPGNTYWLSVAVKNDLSLFAKTVFLQTNGLIAQRSGTEFLTDSQPPRLVSNTIAKTQTAIPQIAEITQPFPSFGGEGAETGGKMYRRVSNRLKTKNRAVSTEDYFRLIRQQYNDVFYSKAVFDRARKGVSIYVVKACEDHTHAGAFLPMVSECKEKDITSFLKDRTSVFSNINVLNFEPQYVKINATVMMKQGFESEGMKKTIDHALNIFLSPWINSTAPQLIIDQGINSAQIAELIKNTEGIKSVESVSFTTWVMDGQSCKIIDASANALQITATSGALFVSCMNHDIICRS